MRHLKKITFLFALLFLSVLPPQNSFSKGAKRRPIIEYWKSPVIGAWKGTVYSTFFNSPGSEGGNALIQKYNVEFQFDGEKRLRKGLFRADTLPGNKGKRRLTRSRFKGTFHGTYVFYTNGEIEVKAIVFSRRNRTDYAFPVKFSGKLTDGRKKIKGSGSLSATSAGRGITLGFGHFSRVRF